MSERVEVARKAYEGVMVPARKAYDEAMAKARYEEAKAPIRCSMRLWRRP